VAALGKAGAAGCGSPEATEIAGACPAPTSFRPFELVGAGDCLGFGAPPKNPFFISSSAWLIWSPRGEWESPTDCKGEATRRRGVCLGGFGWCDGCLGSLGGPSELSLSGSQKSALLLQGDIRICSTSSWLLALDLWTEILGLIHFGVEFHTEVDQIEDGDPLGLISEGT